MYELTDMEADMVKDILKIIGNDRTLNNQMARATGHSVNNFNMVADNVFRKLGNGRVTVEGNGQ